MTDHDDMLMDLSRIDDATEQAALDTRGEGTSALDDVVPAYEFVPDIAIRGVGALVAARNKHDLARVLRELRKLKIDRPEGRRRSVEEIMDAVDAEMNTYRAGALCRYTNGISRKELGMEERAMMAAAVAHEKQLRKEGGVPYIAHPLAVALHLARSGYDEDCTAAALVHDVMEDTDWTEAMLAEALGEEAERCLALVRFATEPPKDVSWHARKAAVVAKLAGATRDERALVIADKGHNLRSLLRALRKRGEAAWTVLRHGRAEQSWFAHALAGVVRDETGEPFGSYVATVEEAVREGWLEAA